MSADKDSVGLSYTLVRMFEGWSLWDFVSRMVYLYCKFAIYLVGYSWRRLKRVFRQGKESLLLGFAFHNSRGFEYSPLPKPSSIRLLYMEKGSDTDIVRCSLKVVDLDSAPVYRALSYTWSLDGSPWARAFRQVVASDFFNPFTRRLLSRWGKSRGEKSRKLILCNSQVMEVQSNLYNALLQLRKSHNSLPFWIDAICINQNDVLERNGQLAIMGDIYSSARQVITWLGTCPTALIGRVDSIRYPPKIHKDIIKNDTATLLPFDLQYQYCFEPIFTMTFLFYIIMSSYFRRIWVLQEYILAKDIVFLLGSEEISPELLADAVGWIKSLNPPSEIRSIYYSALPVLLTHITSLDKVLAARKLFQTGYRWDLEEYLLASRGRQATDPRDLIFAGLALLDRLSLKIQEGIQLEAEPILDPSIKDDDVILSESEQNPTLSHEPFDILETMPSETSSAQSARPTPSWTELHIDYAVSTLEVFSNWAAAMFHSRTGLYSLSLASIRSTYGEYPCWFPIPGETYMDTLRDTKPEIYNACDLPNTFHISSDGKEVLLERAIVFDKITSITDDYLLRELDEPSRLTKFLHFMTDLDTSAYTSREPGYVTIARLLVGNSCEGNNPASGNIGEMFAKWLRVLIEDAEKDFPNFPGLETMQSSYDTFVAKYLPFDPSSFAESDVAAAADVYRRAHHQLCAVREIFITEKGYIGLGSQRTTIGSYIVFIGGVYVPFVMRRDDDRKKKGRIGKGKWSLETSFHLSGEAYLYGFMNGEILKDDNEKAIEPIIIM
ncbi:heterokaryon incompatibility protein-domain-containing protein [Cadophora sp. MPI-SDFR-AT-0126]|nr:heterokaryon incompatibility protein-domain-containing protein [Leotiomycetes sp. MPI-SDFR-AT-0126]